MLKSLRPMALGHVALEGLLRDLADGFERTNSSMDFSVSIGPLASGYEETLDLTLYRCVQESLTNVVRHSKARRVTVSVKETGSPPALEASIVDDGCGIGPDAAPGYGISGMRERVQGLGGCFKIVSGEDSGTEVHIILPVRQPAGLSANRRQRHGESS
jgi:two-component system sensor histidine kinase UhpB